MTLAYNIDKAINTLAEKLADLKLQRKKQGSISEQEYYDEYIRSYNKLSAAIVEILKEDK